MRIWSINEIEFIIKSTESMAQNKIKNKIEQLLLKYKHIHEHGKQQNEWININLFLTCHKD